jgi:uroporphyrinogen decarboxylase
MEPYERIMSAINHQSVDRCPIDYIATPEAHANFKKYLGIDDDEILLQRLGADIRYIGPRFIGPEDMIGIGGGGEAGKDFLGVVWKPVKNKYSTYNEIAFHPLGHVTTVKEVDDYSWPSVDWFDFSHLKEEIARLNKDRRYAIMYFAGGSFESPWYMRGLERFLMDLIERPDIAEAICQHVTDFYKKRALRAIDESNGQIDIIGSGGDIGTQKGMMLSPELWRKHIKSWSEQLIRSFKDMELKTFYHSCGSIVPVIEDFIGMGLDILDPIQPRAAGMDLFELNTRFGGRLTFHGGVDEQHLLPRGTPEQVRNEVRRLIEIIITGKQGNYIVCAAHAIQPDTPVENIIAMYDTALECS